MPLLRNSPRVKNQKSLPQLEMIVLLVLMTSFQKGPVSGNVGEKFQFIQINGNPTRTKESHPKVGLVKLGFTQKGKLMKNALQFKLWLRMPSKIV